MCATRQILLTIVLVCVCIICAIVSMLVPSSTSLEIVNDAKLHLRAALGISALMEKEKFLLPQFSPDGHFLNNAAEVAITCGLSDAHIHYTLDGSTPTEQSPLYSEPLAIAPDNGNDCVTLKAVCIINGETGPVAVHTYFFADAQRHSRPAYVFSLSTDADNLYGYDEGILVPGRRMTITDPVISLRKDIFEDRKIFANYRERGRDWERPVDVEVFDTNCNRLLTQHAGLRVYGGVSRSQLQKSIRLIARSRNGMSHKRFEFPFFPTTVWNNKLPPLYSFKNLILSNSGQDLFSAQIRTPLFTRIALRAGFRWASPSMPASVYINGAYYGFAWLTPRFDAHLLSDFFDKPSDDFVVLSADLAYFLLSSPRYPYLLHWREIEDFNDLITRCKNEPMGDSLDEGIRHLLSVNETLLYYAIETYLDNRDWPQHNIKMWKYVGADANGIAELDGRWHYILFDLDASGMSNWHGVRPPSNTTLTRILKDSSLLKVLLHRREYAEQFANDICDMAFGHYGLERVTTTLTEMDEQCGDELQYAALQGEYNPPFRFEQMGQGRANILRFFRERPQYMLDELRSLLGFTRLYHVQVDGMAKLNTLGPINPDGWYFWENSVEVVPSLPPDKRFLRWEVNGQPRESQRLKVSAADALNNLVKVRLISEDRPYPLVIDNACERGSICGFALHNRSAGPVHLDGLFLSDNPSKPRKFALPSSSLPSGERLFFAGKDARHAAALGRIQLNFNPRLGETVYLYDGAGKQVLATSPVENCDLIK